MTPKVIQGHLQRC